MSLRILQIHNKYHLGWGGETTVAELEADLLRRYGHCVEIVSVWTRELEVATPARLLAAAFGTIWSFRGYSLIREAIERHTPDVVHVHNTFPLLSPSIFWAAAKAGVPIVHSLHNFRLTCANALLLRGDIPCQKCVGRFPWAAFRYRCYRRSFPQTGLVVGMYLLHRLIGTFNKKVDAYIALSNFSKEILVRSRLPAERIFVKPNFTVDPGGQEKARDRAIVFAGMIASYKGVRLLLDAWVKIKPDGYKLVLLGEGPDSAKLERKYSQDASILWYGARPRSQVLEVIRTSRWLALPSLAYENFPMAVLEALSMGTPVIVPNHGPFVEMVSHQQEGLLFLAGNKTSLESALKVAVETSDLEWARLSMRAREKYLREYTDEVNYPRLISVYREAIEHRSRSQSCMGRSTREL